MPTQMWREPLKRLLDILISQDQYHKLLLGIDQTIAKTENLKPSALFDEFNKSLLSLSKTLDCVYSALYVRNGQDGYILSIPHGSYNWPQKLDMHAIHSHLGKCCEMPQHICNSNIREINISDEDSTIGVISGIAGSAGTNENHLFAVFIFLRNEFDSDILWDDEALEQLRTVSLQLSNGYRFAIAEQRESVLKDMVVEFFEADMEPQKCLNAFSSLCQNLFPSFDPLNIEGDIKTQLLLWDPIQPDFLSIKATTGGTEGKMEPIGSIVSVKDSITGKLILNPEKKYYFCDPQDEKDSYIPYLGSQMRSELAVPVQLTELCSSTGEKCRAIINFESERESAFSDYHIDYITTYFREGEVFQQMVDALLMQQRRSERGLNAAYQTLQDYTGYWVNMFSHAAGNQFKPINDNLFSLKRRLKKEAALDLSLKDYIDSIVGDVESSISQLKNINDEYCRYLVEISLSEDREIADLIESAISMWKADGLKKKKGIGLSFTEKSESPLIVYTSAMLSQHIYNLIDNSIYWVGKKKERLATVEKSDFEGNVSVYLEQLSPYIDNEKYRSRYCSITIKDNGEGAPPFVLSKLRDGDKQFTTRPRGSGLGMFATTQYVRSIGGSVSLESKEKQYFQVRITLPLSND